jgi:ATP-dependent DNA ligase
MQTTIDFAALAGEGVLAQNAQPTKNPFAGVDPGKWAAEPKYDGWRLLAVVGEDRVDFFARSGNSYNGKLPKVEAELLAHFPAGTVLDGEAVAITVLDNGCVLNEWGIAQGVLTKVNPAAAADKITFMVFDLIAHRGIDARPLTYAQRRSLLERIFEDEDAFEAVALTVQVEPTEAQYDVMVQQGFEGMILKRLDAPYASNKRDGAGWIKVKATFTIEGVVMGFQDGKSGFAGMVGAVIFGQFENGVLTERGKCSGMDMRTRVSMTQEPEKWLGKVIEVAHNGVSIGTTDSGRFRHPRFKRVRADKAPEQVVVHDA